MEATGYHESAAPAELIRRDFAMLDQRETLRTTWANEQVLLLQSVLGHAYEGHGLFKGRRYPNTTQDDIVRALRLDPVAVRGARQALIDEIRAYAQAVIAGRTVGALVDDRGTPLLGISTLRFLQLNPEEVLGGLYLGGLRDDPQLRAEVEDETGIRIGGGRSYHVDFHRMHQAGITGEDLARGEWEGRLEELRNEGIIVDATQAARPSVHYQYVRHRKGCGASDDAAIVGAGLRWGLSVAMGVFLADAIDTLEKYVPRYSDQDADIARDIAERHSSLTFTKEDVKLLIRLAAAEDPEVKCLPDSSLRHLLSVDRHTDLCALEAHILAIVGTPAPSIGLGHERFPSHRFYALLRRRLEDLAG